jgi:hypothetical protein
MNKPLVDRINDYLRHGGLNNPELMDHDAVLQLLMDCREALVSYDYQIELAKRSVQIAEEALEAAASCKVPTGYNSAQIARIIGITRIQARRIEELEREHRPHGLVNELEREIIRLNEELSAVWREHSMYMRAWCREIGGFIRAKHHQIDGYVLRTRDAIKEAYDRGRQDGLHDSE